MTIKEIKERYKRYGCDGGGHNSFAVYDYKDGNGKMVVVVHFEMVGGYLWRDVYQVVRVSDGKEMLAPGRCRPCDNLDDAIDVASEMMWDNGGHTNEEGIS